MKTAAFSVAVLGIGAFLVWHGVKALVVGYAKEWDSRRSPADFLRDAPPSAYHRSRSPFRYWIQVLFFFGVGLSMIGYGSFRFYAHLQRQGNGDAPVVAPETFHLVRRGATEEEVVQTLGEGTRHENTMAWAGTDGNMYIIVFAGNAAPAEREVVFMIRRSPDGKSVHLEDDE